MRSPVAVVKQIQAEVPVDLKGEFKKTAREDLDWYIEDFSYKAPEQTPDCFGRLSEYIWDHLFEKKEYLPKEWQRKIASILSTKTIEEINAINETLKPK